MSKSKREYFSISGIPTLLKEEIDEDQESLCLGTFLDSEKEKKGECDGLNSTSNEELNLKLAFKECSSNVKNNKLKDHKNKKETESRQRKEVGKDQKKKEIGKDQKKEEMRKEQKKEEESKQKKKETSENCKKAIKGKKISTDIHKKKTVNEDKKVSKNSKDKNAQTMLKDIDKNYKEEISKDKKETNNDSEKRNVEKDRNTKLKETEKEKSLLSKALNIKIPYRETNHIPTCLFEPDNTSNSDSSRISKYNVYIHETSRLFSVDSACSYVFIKRMSKLE